MKLYHYTIADRLIKIIISGYLKLTPNEPADDERPAVWLTNNDKWDETAFFGYPMDVLNNAGCIRITMESDDLLGVMKADDVKYSLGNWRMLVQSAESVGVNFDDWYVSFDEIQMKHFRKVELWMINRWVEVPLDVLNEN